MSDPDECKAEASSVGRAATGRRSSHRVAWTVGAAVALAAAMSPMLLATPASAKTAPVPNTVIATVPVAGPHCGRGARRAGSLNGGLRLCSARRFPSGIHCGIRASSAPASRQSRAAFLALGPCRSSS